MNEQAIAIYERGYEACQAKKARTENPYQYGTDEYHRWENGWYNGQGGGTSPSWLRRAMAD